MDINTHPNIVKLERDGFAGTEPPVVDICPVCREPVYEGDLIFALPADWVHEECLSGYFAAYRKEAAPKYDTL